MAQYTPQYLDHVQLTSRVYRDDNQEVETRLFIGQGDAVWGQGYPEPLPPFERITDLGDPPLVFDAFPTSCGKTLPRRDALTRHMKSHSYDREYVCYICEKHRVFYRHDHLIQHFRCSHKFEEQDVAPFRKRHGGQSRASAQAGGVDPIIEVASAAAPRQVLASGMDESVNWSDPLDNDTIPLHEKYPEFY